MSSGSRSLKDNDLFALIRNIAQGDIGGYSTQHRCRNTGGSGNGKKTLPYRTWHRRVLATPVLLLEEANNPRHDQSCQNLQTETDSNVFQR